MKIPTCINVNILAMYSRALTSSRESVWKKQQAPMTMSSLVKRSKFVWKCCMDLLYTSCMPICLVAVHQKNTLTSSRKRTGA